jgi:hypothetical protein
MCCLIIWVNGDRFEAERTRIRHKYDWLTSRLRWRKSIQQAPPQQLQPSNLPSYKDTFVQVQEGDLEPQPPSKCEKLAGHLE